MLASLPRVCYSKSSDGRGLFPVELSPLPYVEQMDVTSYATESAEQLSSQLLHLTDEKLLLRYREAGEREVFAELVRRYERELYGYLRRYLGNTELAEDAFQAVFLQVHLKCSLFEKGRRVRPWLYAIATNQAIDTQRRNRRHRMVSLDYVGRSVISDERGDYAELMVSDEADPLANADNQERNELLEQAMGQLSEQMRSVIHLVYYQGLKYREAAEIMSIPVGTVKSRLHTAIAKLAEFWNQRHPDLD